MTARPQRGFTLLEMLVAITVFGLLVSMVYGMLRLGSRGWEAGGERIEQADAMRVGWTFLHRALSNARDVKSLQEDSEGLHFRGGEDSLEFVADMPAYLGTGGLHVVSLAVEDADLRPGEEGPDRRLALHRIPLLDYDQEGFEEKLQSAVLVDQLESLQIDYFGALQDDDARARDEGAEWHREWIESATLPVLVRIRVQPYGRDPWPILIAHPQLGRDRKAEGESDGLSEGVGGDGPLDPDGEPPPPDDESRERP